MWPTPGTGIGTLAIVLGGWQTGISGSHGFSPAAPGEAAICGALAPVLRRTLLHGSEKEVEGQPNRFRDLYQVSEVRTHRGAFEGQHPTHLMDTTVSQQQVTAEFPQLNNPQFSGFGTTELGC